MNQLFSEMLEVISATFEALSSALPAPQRVEIQDGWAYRYESKDIHHAVVLKLALIQSSLRAAMVLNENGYVLEQAMLQRIIEEANEDVFFLALADTNDSISPLHKQYLDTFWREEGFRFNQTSEANRNLPTVSRKKIRAYVINSQETGGNPSRTTELAKFIHRMYSGYVHGSSTHIMEMYVGSPAYFHTKGLLGTPRIAEYQQGLWDHMYRGLLSHIVAAKLFGSDEHVNQLLTHRQRFASLAGKDY